LPKEGVTQGGKRKILTEKDLGKKKSEARVI
jgi:hypothetical protein